MVKQAEKVLVALTLFVSLMIQVCQPTMAKSGHIRTGSR